MEIKASGALMFKFKLKIFWVVKRCQRHFKTFEKTSFYLRPIVFVKRLGTLGLERHENQKENEVFCQKELFCFVCSIFLEQNLENISVASGCIPEAFASFWSKNTKKTKGKQCFC